MNIRAFMIAVTLAGAVPVTAHHAATFFDNSKTITIRGTIKKYEWTNPHVWIWVSVADARGEVKVWGIETANLSMAKRMGMNKNSFKAGDKVTMLINPMKDGREGGRFRRATFEDGHVVNMAPPNEDAAGPLPATP